MSAVGGSAVCLALVGTLFLAGCGDHPGTRRVVQKVGPRILRDEAVAVCRDQFPKEGAVKILESHWPASVRAFAPLSVWAEPDGAYLLLDSDADGERGVFVPRVLLDKDPLCGPSLKHVKLAEGVYWYDRKRQ